MLDRRDGAFITLAGYRAGLVDLEGEEVGDGLELRQRQIERELELPLRRRAAAAGVMALSTLRTVIRAAAGDTARLCAANARAIATAASRMADTAGAHGHFDTAAMSFLMVAMFAAEARRADGVGKGGRTG